MIQLLAAAASKSNGFHITGSLSVVGVVLTICAGIGFILAYTRSSLAKSTIEIQAQQIEAQAQRMATLESDLLESKTHRASLEVRVNSLEAYIKNLEALKTGSEAIIELGKAMEAKWAQNSQEHALIVKLLS